MASSVPTGFSKPGTSINKNSAELPHLASSLAIPGLPPPRPLSLHADAAAERLKQFMIRWQVDHSFASYSEVCLSCASMMYPGAVSCDRLTAISMHWTLFCILDDAFFDPRNTILREILQQHSGVDITIFNSPRGIREFATNLDILFRQEHQPHGPIKPIEGMWWEIGQEMRRFSNLSWFTRFANALIDYWNASIECHAADMAGDCSHTKDLESYTRMRTREFGGHFVILQIEFSRNDFLPDEVRVLPIFQQATNAAAIQVAYVNDIFSYAKEVGEANSRNLIKVLMGSERLRLPEAAWKAVELANSYSRVILELEKELRTLDAVSCFMEGLKCGISGHISWLSKNKRYRCPDSPFPELQDVTSAPLMIRV